MAGRKFGQLLCQQVFGCRPPLAARPLQRSCMHITATASGSASNSDDNADKNLSIDREIAIIALPTLAALAAEPVAALVDTMWVGRIGPLELAACAAAAAIFSLVTKLINMPLAAVTTSLVAAATAEPAAGNVAESTWRGGRGQCGRAGRGHGSAAEAPDRAAAASGALCAGLAAGVLQGATLLILGRAALHAWCSSAAAASALVDTAHAYLAVRAVGAPLNACLMVAQAACRGIGRPRLPLRATLIANGVNLVLDPLLIFSLHMGVAGAAWATVAGQAVALVDVLWKLKGLRALGRVDGGTLESMRALLPSTALLVLRSAAISGTFSFATAAATRIGTTEAAAHAICFQVWLAASLLADALALAAQALISESVLRRPQRALRFARRALALGAALGGGLAAVLLVLREHAAAAFTADPSTQAVAVRVLVWVALLQPVTALAFVWDGLLYGVAGFRFAALAMPLNVLPALACITAASTQHSAPAALACIWAGLGAVMLMRVLTAYLPFRMRWGVFAQLPASSA